MGVEETNKMIHILRINDREADGVNIPDNFQETRIHCGIKGKLEIKALDDDVVVMDGDVSTYMLLPKATIIHMRMETVR